MRREGSPWRGLSVVFFRELFDHLTSVRMLVLEFLVVLLGGAVVYFAAEQIRNTTAEDPFLFLRLFAPPGQSLLVVRAGAERSWCRSWRSGSASTPSTANTTAAPCRASWRSRSIATRCCSGNSWPGSRRISISLVTLWLLVIGFGLFRLGVPPSGEEIGRLFIFLLVTIAYAGIWLALAVTFSVFFRSTATAALVALGLWLFLALLWPALAQMLGEVISPSDLRFAQLGLPTPDTLMWQQGLSRLSPGTLYGEAVVAMLNPDAQSMTTLLAQFQGRIGSPLPLDQSILQAWPQIVSLIAGTILLYVIGYVAFQRQEVQGALTHVRHARPRAGIQFTGSPESDGRD